MTTHAFIFARGGSKGLPRKNVRVLAGKPLIQHAIEVAQQVACIERVFVSTDDKEIASVASGCGAIIIARPDELATDISKEWLAWQHAVSWVESHYGVFNTFVSLPTTCPLRQASDVEAAIEQLRISNADICITITPTNRNPYFNMVKKQAGGLVGLVAIPEVDVFRRQDAPVVYDITPCVYVTTPDFIQHSQGLFDGNVTNIEVPKERAVDIDDIYDFHLAEILLSKKRLQD